MAETTAERYLELMGEDREARLALLACAAALRLDDEAARDAIHLVTGSNGHTDRLLRQVKRLSCVWIDWNGVWYLAEDVRVALTERLGNEVTPEIYDQLRLLLARKAEEKADSLPRDGQVTAYESRLMRLESGFQRIFVPAQAAAGAEQLAEVWLNTPVASRNAAAAAVDYLAPEIERRLNTLPIEVIFLRGMSARQRGDKATARACFQTVWRSGRPGEIFAIAAHLYGILISRSNPDVAEDAFRDSIQWDPRPQGQAQPWHSLGNLLSRDRNRRQEAEEAYHISLDLRSDPEDKAQVWHSLGNLLAGQGRLQEAEDAYNTSMEPRTDPIDQATVYSSWADALLKTNDPKYYERAVEQAQKSQELDPHGLKTQGVALRVISDVRERQGRLAEAIEALELLMENDRRLGNTRFEYQVQNRIDRLRARLNDSGE